MHAPEPRGGVVLPKVLTRRSLTNPEVFLEFTVLKKVLKAAISTWTIRSGVLC